MEVLLVLQNPVAILTLFREMTDPRLDRRKLHALIDVLFVGFCGCLCGCNSWMAVQRFCEAQIEWLRKYVPLRNGVPSHDTFGRIFALIDPQKLAECFRVWLQSLHDAAGGKHIAIDGKTLANSYDAASGKKALHLVCAFATQTRLVLGQQATDEKSNEITAIPELLTRLELAGAIVTIDAMGCQKQIAQQIHQAGGNYVLALKSNHRTLFETAVEAFIQAIAADEKPRGFRTWIDRRSKKETREYYVMPIPENLPGADQWPGLQTLGMAARRYQSKGEEKMEIRYYLSSLPPKVKQFAKLVRDHWGIENTLHWSLDVNFTEDQSRTRLGNGPETNAYLRRLVVSLLKQDTTLSGSLIGKRQVLGWSPPARDRFFAEMPRI